MARVVLTQPWPRVRGIEQRLRDLGHEPLALPLSRIVERVDEPGVAGVAARLAGFDWVIMVSPAAVAAAARLTGGHWPAHTGAAVVGPGSLQAIADCALGVAPDRLRHPEGPVFDADALIDTPPLNAPRGLRVLVLRGDGGSERWIARLRAAGASVETCEIYRREPIAPPPATLRALRELLDRTPAPVFVFTQRDAVERIAALLGRAGLKARAHRAPALAIHARIVTALRDDGWREVHAIDPGDRALAAALELFPESPSSHRV
ncbi:MAG: uroporphyrinogen-III synthase [Burkholderiaceae bacterium]|jgi:uroporphyrinogen-III synthase|nr:uroporphyrinogen-III synthase [Burkholderiaceae bacterium]MEB2351073.1 uroporphyrinogen-III synthase [Burkholderiaceae bacterium]